MPFRKGRFLKVNVMSSINVEYPSVVREILTGVRVALYRKRLV